MSQDGGNTFHYNRTVTEYSKCPVPTQFPNHETNDDIEKAFLDNIGSFTVETVQQLMTQDSIPKQNTLGISVILCQH